jgi:transcriptional regulator with XRE-family HTH domain
MPPERKSKPLSSDRAALMDAINAAMAKNGMTQETLADASGLSARKISDLVRGQGNPTYLSMLKLCGGLKTSFLAFVQSIEGADKIRGKDSKPPEL